MNKEYTSLGLMSGTSGDGVDASIIKSDGDSNYQDIENQYFEYDNEIYEKIPLYFIYSSAFFCFCPNCRKSASAKNGYH